MEEVMTMFSNSDLVTYVRLSPNYSGRNGKKIKKITIHHMAGNLSIETCGNIFANPSRKASSTYGIDTMGRIGLYVEEMYRPWTSSSRSNDEEAVTIEVANCTIGGDWEISEEAMNSLIILCVDICRRNGIPKLVYTEDPTGNVTLHSMFANTVCPGPYIKRNINYIVESVNKLLNGQHVDLIETPTIKHDKIAVDGKWGPGTTRKAQTIMRTTIDGVISNQFYGNRIYLPNAFTGSWQFKKDYCGDGSKLVRAIQKKVGGVAIDGQMGVETVKAFQKFLGVTSDGYMGPETVKAFQIWLNNQG